jgi:hypothetical protein
VSAECGGVFMIAGCQHLLRQREHEIEALLRFPKHLRSKIRHAAGQFVGCMQMDEAVGHGSEDTMG